MIEYRKIRRNKSLGESKKSINSVPVHTKTVTKVSNGRLPTVLETTEQATFKLRPTTVLQTANVPQSSYVAQLYPADGKIPKNYSRVFCSSQASTFEQADYSFAQIM
jgi:hypothetical protein